jgi:hypothetical protein
MHIPRLILIRTVPCTHPEHKEQGISTEIVVNQIQPTIHIIQFIIIKWGKLPGEKEL